MGKPETDHIYPRELGQLEEEMGMGFIQLGARVVSMSQTMKDTFLPNVSTIVFFIIFSCSLPSLLDRTLHPKPQMTLTALLEAR